PPPVLPALLCMTAHTARRYLDANGCAVLACLSSHRFSHASRPRRFRIAVSYPRSCPDCGVGGGHTSTAAVHAGGPNGCNASGISVSCADAHESNSGVEHHGPLGVSGHCQCFRHPGAAIVCRGNGGSRVSNQCHCTESFIDEG